MWEVKTLLRDSYIQVADVARRYGVSRITLYKHVGVIVRRANEDETNVPAT